MLPDISARVSSFRIIYCITLCLLFLSNQGTLRAQNSTIVEDPAPSDSYLNYLNDDFDELPAENDSLQEVVDWDRLSKYLPQRSSATVTWLAGSGSESLGITQINLSTTFARPTPWRQTIFSVSPSFGMEMLDAPAETGLPTELYRGSISFTFMKPINESLQMMVGLSPGFASDLEAHGSEVFRFMAFATGTWQYKPNAKLTFGVAATGRDDIPVLPMVGISWTPTDDWIFDAAAPRPRIARRVTWGNSAGNDWLYVAGEFGGGSWAVERAGREDELTIRDFRLILGWERKSEGKINAHFEVGYVFSRKVEFEYDSYEYNPSDTVMLRAGLSF